jgi:hypothetical protein
MYIAIASIAPEGKIFEAHRNGVTGAFCVSHHVSLLPTTTKKIPALQADAVLRLIFTT